MWYDTTTRFKKKAEDKWIMKRIIALVLAVLMCFSLTACAKKYGDIKVSRKAEKAALTDRYENEVDPLVIDDVEVPVTDFLIEHLSEYIKREDHLARVQEYTNLGGDEPKEFKVTRVIESLAEDLGSSRHSAHFIGIQADCTWGADGVKYERMVLAVSYVTGEVYSQFDYDASRYKNTESWEYYWGNILFGPLASMDYNGEALINDRTETTTELSQEEIDVINEALYN